MNNKRRQVCFEVMIEEFSELAYLPLFTLWVSSVFVHPVANGRNYSHTGRHARCHAPCMNTYKDMHLHAGTHALTCTHTHARKGVGYINVSGDFESQVCTAVCHIVSGSGRGWECVLGQPGASVAAGLVFPMRQGPWCALLSLIIVLHYQ